jgi:four helix bundle protein
MKNTKAQSPNTKKPSSSKPEPTVTYVTGNGGCAWVLKDEPTADDPEQRHPFDFEERTALFGEAIIRFAKRIPRNPGNDRLINQIVGSGTSVGANFCEANDSVSKKDFRYCVKRCIKEAKETRFFLRMIATAESSLAVEARQLYREATELIRILVTMHKK